MTADHFLHFVMLGFLYALAGTVAFQLLTGRINMAGLLSQKGGDTQITPGRVQLLLATIAMSTTYLTQVANSPGNKMPDVDPNWLFIIGGSSGIYAIEKAFAAWKNSQKQSS